MTTYMYNYLGSASNKSYRNIWVAEISAMNCKRVEASEYTYLLLAEFEAPTVSYGPSFSPWLMARALRP